MFGLSEGCFSTDKLMSSRSIDRPGRSIIHNVASLFSMESPDMPSFFPGMDPFIEGYEWEDFHSRCMTSIADAIVPAVRPDYSVRTERRIYVEHQDYEAVPGQIRPDITIVREMAEGRRRKSQGQSAVATVEPVERSLPGPFEIREKYLVIRQLNSGEVVTVIELLSPSNKRTGSEGREVYLSKRQEIIESPTSLVELDLLRSGERLPTVESLPEGDYYAFVRRSSRRMKVDVYAWPLNHRLPVIPIPLATGDREVSLDLQAVFDGVYDRAGYDYSLRYDHAVVPKLNKPETRWVNGLLKNRSKGRK